MKFDSFIYHKNQMAKYLIKICVRKILEYVGNEIC